MNWWNLGGLNPKEKDFREQHPDKTMIGMAWAYQWRLMVLVFLCEIIFFAVVGAIVAIAS